MVQHVVKCSEIRWTDLTANIEADPRQWAIDNNAFNTTRCKKYVLRLRPTPFICMRTIRIGCVQSFSENGKFSDIDFLLIIMQCNLLKFRESLCISSLKTFSLKWHEIFIGATLERTSNIF